MFLIDKSNITDYLKMHMPYLDYSKPLIISEIGDGNENEDGDGYLNFVFRVSDGNYKLIVKQSREHGRIASFLTLPVDRGEQEYESMRIRSAIVPEYIPKLYFCDKENHVFVTEDVSHMHILRFGLNQNIIFPKLAKQLGEYLAKTHFYTSEYYLDTKTFRDMTIHFMNHSMRNIFDNFHFITKTEDHPATGSDLDARYASYVLELLLDPQVQVERHKLHQKYIGQGQTFIHGDFHTSNVFIDQEDMKVIDMEYTFCGPFAYDVGYMQSHLLSQYLSANFRLFSSEEERKEFKDYMLSSLREVYEEYCNCFFDCWNKDAKDFYRAVPLLQESVRMDLLHDTTAFCANSNLSRTTGDIGYPEYDMIDDPAQQAHAICMSVVADVNILKNHQSYQSIDDFINDILATEKEYMSHFD
ncbi:MAG: phosphotransferase [Eubacteriales bacterium]|nr:phosphotransferase [Eubacteriales bacterium]